MPTRTQKNERQKELENIRKDINSLRGNVVALSRTITDDVAEEAANGIGLLKEKSYTTMERVEDNVRHNPGRAMFVAFIGGLMASVMLRR
jgi:hypothetical protein